MLLLAQPGLHLGHSGLTLVSMVTPVGAAHGHHHGATCPDGSPAASVPATTHDHGDRHDCTSSQPTTPDHPREATRPNAQRPRAPTAREPHVQARATTLRATARGPPRSLTIV